MRRIFLAALLLLFVRPVTAQVGIMVSFGPPGIAHLRTASMPG